MLTSTNAEEYADSASSADIILLYNDNYCKIYFNEYHTQTLYSHVQSLHSAML